MYCEAVSRVSSSVLLIGEDYTCCQVLSIGEPLLLTGDLRRATLRGMKVPFYQWLQGKLKELNMSQADVIRNAEGGIKSSQMSRVYNGKGKYDAKTIRTIAKGMKLPQAELFYRAGLTDEEGQIDRERYLRKKAEYEARRPAFVQPQAMALPALGDAILKAPPLMLRDIVRALFERIEIGPNGLTFIPRAVHADLFGR